MNRKSIISITVIALILTAGTLFLLNPRPAAEREVIHNVEVKGLVLKYVLIDTAYEIYQTNVEGGAVFSESSYASIGEDTHEHFLWMKQTYHQLDESMKADLTTLFSQIHAWQLMNLTTQLEDRAGLEEILEKLTSSREINQDTKDAMERFFTYFYENGFKAYLSANEAAFQGYADRMNRQLQDTEPDIIGFIEAQSGVRFETNYKPEFYYTLRPIGAMGFDDKDIKISTIQRTVQSYRNLLGTPFHEFSHELFRTFTSGRAFRRVCEDLKSVESLRTSWEDTYANSYDWVGWCEENLVEGFAQYLEYKYYGQINSNGIYQYDLEFYQYLREIDFDPETTTLKEASISFYKNILSQQP